VRRDAGDTRIVARTEASAKVLISEPPGPKPTGTRSDARPNPRTSTADQNPRTVCGWIVEGGNRSEKEKLSIRARDSKRWYATPAMARVLGQSASGNGLTISRTDAMARPRRVADHGSQPSFLGIGVDLFDQSHRHASDFHWKLLR